MPKSSISHTAFISVDQMTATETSVPVAFTEEDIMHYVLMEQAQLFPMLDQEIYFDFLIKSIDEEYKKVMVVACNMKDFSHLASTLRYLKISHEDFKTLNLLPWRQREKKRAQKQAFIIFGVVGVSVGLIVLIVSLCYLHIARLDEKKSALLSQRTQVLLSKLEMLEQSKQVFQSLMYRWQDQMSVMHHQSDIEKLLITIEVQRPENLVLAKIVYRKKKLLIKGKSKETSAIRGYVNNLRFHAISAKLTFMGSSADTVFPVQFEIEAEGL